MYNLERDIEILVGMYEDGATYEELAELIDMSCSRVKNSINTYIKDKLRNKVVSLSDKGLNHIEIAKELGITYNRTKSILAKSGKMTIEDIKKPELLEPIAQDYKNGLSTLEIRKKYKMSDNTVLVYLGVAGVPLRDRTVDANINEKYLNTLDISNVFELGIMFSMCNVYTINKSQKRIDFVTNKRYEKCTRNFK